MFCLEPSCGVAYTRIQRSERNKLATLGVDNRSTATTILAVRSLVELRGGDLNPEARKLLSFTDNRQDASLQAGHFNDFVQVALLRSALFKACMERSTGLRHGDLSRCVFDAMNLDFEDYAADPEVRGPARLSTENALRRVLEYLLYRDLERGWRVTAPNLEDCGLLRFEYEGLSGEDGLLGETELWKAGFSIREGRGSERFVAVPETLRKIPAEVREELVGTLLDYLRRALAVKVDVLDRGKQHDLVVETNPRLLESTAWYLEDEGELTGSVVAYPRPRSKEERRREFYVSSYGAYGQYLRRTLRPYLSTDQRVGREETDEIIQFLFLSLKRYGIVEQVRSGRDGDDPGYQLNVDALRWFPGAGVVRPVDRTRLLEEGEIPPEVNHYFVECYRRFVELKGLLEAREHTAQVTSEERQEREERFREGELPLLFCSPTMELGVDISQLNLVNLRNVPPTPANYAQRSGRAGRSGQPAMVFTYCAGRSPHDQYFFREPARMVSGAVEPPRIDLRNRDLIRSHVHAIWMEAAKPDLGKTLTTVLELGPENGNGELPLSLKAAIKDELRNSVHRGMARVKANAVIEGIRSELEGTAWFHDDWVDEVLGQVERSFDSACDRWRSLYLLGNPSTRAPPRHHRGPLPPRPNAGILKGCVHKPRARYAFSRKPKESTRGILLPYRYFATEGFLPGYNFPRLPISAYVPGRRRIKGRDEFISRPRFLAISEFGPRTLIYHEGARYRVYKVNLDFGSNSVEDTHQLTTDTMNAARDAAMPTTKWVIPTCPRSAIPATRLSIGRPASIPSWRCKT